MKRGPDRNEKVLLGIGFLFSLFALSGLIYYFVAYFRLSFTAHYLDIQFVSDASTQTDLLLSLEIAVMVSMAFIWTAIGRQCRRVRTAARRVPTEANEKAELS
jgi:hypothetical protein